jgi:transcription elongation GreA/GreB family factor
MSNPKLELKHKLLAECNRMQKEIVQTHKTAMQEAQQSAIESDDNAEDSLMDSYREEMQNQRDMYAKQLEHSMDDFNTLSQVNPDKETEVVSFGSVVVTETQKLFISISLGNVKVGDDAYFAVSPAAPLYKAMAGKKAGETFPFRDKQIKLLDVF